MVYMVENIVMWNINISNQNYVTFKLSVTVKGGEERVELVNIAQE
jgi:hypothetical protein